MQRQLPFEFGGAVLPPGLIFVPAFLAPDEEQSLLAYLKELPFQRFVMHGVPARRRIISFGAGYSFASRRLSSAVPIPEELKPLRARVAAVAGADAEAFGEALVTEYQPGIDGPGAGIGWHRDAPPFGIVAGVSLGGSCPMRFRERSDHRRVVIVELTPRSLYVLDGAVRNDWEHMIPPVHAERYSITFRTLRRAVGR